MGELLLLVAWAFKFSCEGSFCVFCKACCVQACHDVMVHVILFRFGVQLPEQTRQDEGSATARERDGLRTLHFRPGPTNKD